MEDKIQTVVQGIYGGRDVEYARKAQLALKTIKANGWDRLPICIAKTQYSFSDDPKLLGAPTDFTIHVSDIIPKIGRASWSL